MTEKREINLEHPAYPKYATVYSEKDTDAKACILYFHGGGLLYGSREDLPRRHIDTLTRAGYIIISYDYPLAPAARLDTIMGDVRRSLSLPLSRGQRQPACRARRNPLLLRIRIPV